MNRQVAACPWKSFSNPRGAGICALGGLAAVPIHTQAGPTLPLKAAIHAVRWEGTHWLRKSQARWVWDSHPSQALLAQEVKIWTKKGKKEDLGAVRFWLQFQALMVYVAAISVAHARPYLAQEYSCPDPRLPSPLANCPVEARLGHLSVSRVTVMSFFPSYYFIF